MDAPPPNGIAMGRSATGQLTPERAADFVAAEMESDLEGEVVVVD